ncbi:DUF6285 domain-containing protein [Sphingoaurantiacus capsulatus]|uniref:DUF6285 domain-containing protein n=1 Tax=Sphingoaurantiacus capsulatus TaxID=1771310 RepID=A0ABV7XC47_9SPHN
MSGHPTAAELVEAVRGYLASIESRLSGREAFHAKVAGNVLALVERELQQQPEIVETAALARLLGHNGDLAALRREVCEAFRAGRLTAETPGVVDTLLEATRARIAVDNPKFSTYRRLADPK